MSTANIITVAEYRALMASQKKCRSNGGKRADLGNRYYRSTMEANYQRYLNWQQAHDMIQGSQYEPKGVEYAFPLKRGERFYKPDFIVTLLDGSIEIHETKGWMDSKSATKLKRMAKYYPDIKVKVIDYAEYLAITRTMKHIIPGWE